MSMRNTELYLRHMRHKSANLYTARVAISLWFDVDCAETRALVTQTARADWGAGTECTFNRDRMEVTVEHLDGRREVIRGIAPKREMAS